VPEGDPTSQSVKNIRRVNLELEQKRFPDCIRRHTAERDGLCHLDVGTRDVGSEHPTSGMSAVCGGTIHHVPAPLNPSGSPNPRSQPPDYGRPMSYAGNYRGGPLEQPGRRGRNEEATPDKRPASPEPQRLAE